MKHFSRAALAACAAAFVIGLATPAVAADDVPDPTQQSQSIEATPTLAAIPAGPTTIVHGESKMCIDARGAASANGTAVQLYDCNGSKAQSWILDFPRDVNVKIALASAENTVLDMTDFSRDRGGKAQLWAFGEGANQSWRLETASWSGAFIIQNEHSGLCLSAPEGAGASTVLVQEPCTSDRSQQFSFGSIAKIDARGIAGSGSEPLAPLKPATVTVSSAGAGADLR